MPSLLPGRPRASCLAYSHVTPYPPCHLHRLTMPTATTAACRACTCAMPRQVRGARGVWWWCGGVAATVHGMRWWGGGVEERRGQPRAPLRSQLNNSRALESSTQARSAAAHPASLCPPLWQARSATWRCAASSTALATSPTRVRRALLPYLGSSRVWCSPVESRGSELALLLYGMTPTHDTHPPAAHPADFLGGQIETDREGYVKVRHGCLTNVEGVFSAGGQ